MPGSPCVARSVSTSGVMKPRFSATIGSGPMAAVSASNRSPPGPRCHSPCIAVVASAGTCQYATNPRK